MKIARPKMPRILFFVGGVMPTDDEIDHAEELAPMRVSFRNANLVPDTGALEHCDGWAGDATPKRYRKAFGTAEEAGEAYGKARDAARVQTQEDRDAATEKALTANVVDTTAAVKKAEKDKGKTDETAKTAKENADKAKEAADNWKPNA